MGRITTARVPRPISRIIDSLLSSHWQESRVKPHWQISKLAVMMMMITSESVYARLATTNKQAVVLYVRIDHIRRFTFHTVPYSSWLNVVGRCGPGHHDHSRELLKTKTANSRTCARLQGQSLTHPGCQSCRSVKHIFSPSHLPATAARQTSESSQYTVRPYITLKSSLYLHRNAYHVDSITISCHARQLCY